MPAYLVADKMSCQPQRSAVLISSLSLFCCPLPQIPAVVSRFRLRLLHDPSLDPHLDHLHSGGGGPLAAGGQHSTDSEDLDKLQQVGKEGRVAGREDGREGG